MSSYTFGAFCKTSFRLIRDSMIQQEDLPLVDVLDDDRFEQAFAKHDVTFGNNEDSVYTPSVTLWALISQVFFAEEQRSCKAAVFRIATLWAKRGKVACDENTGDYCKARLKIPFEAVRELTKGIAEDAEQEVGQHNDQVVTPLSAEEHRDAMEQQLTPEVIADVKSRSVGGRILLFDGFTVNAADTHENQAEYPQNPAQTEGVGFPILRCVTLVSMVTGLLIDLVCGPYCGKASGETSLLRQLYNELRPGDILVADSYLCTYWIVAACQLRGVKIVMKNHHKRDDDPLGAKRFNKTERLATWLRPVRPDWMDEAEYQTMPKQIVIRLVDVSVTNPGFRPTRFTVATTIMDRKDYPASWIASVYQSRWLVELDIRAIKCSLHMDILRAKTPAMVRTELWSCLLAYNLIRLKMLQSCIANDRAPRSVSFTATMQLLATSWVVCAVMGVCDAMADLGQSGPCSEQVGHRGGRFEPRKNKRRPKLIGLMTKPRHVYHAELAAAV
jgi:hypothetical protein